MEEFGLEVKGEGNESGILTNLLMGIILKIEEQNLEIFILKVLG